jgi:hypothetical protein
MDEQAAQVLYEADRRGVRQIKGSLSNGADGLCAVGLLIRAHLLESLGIADGCPLCRAKKVGSAKLPLDCEQRLIVHLNDDHDLTFSEIARKLGPDAAGSGR